MKDYTSILVLSLMLGIISCSQTKQPNFLFIIADDQSYNTISALGNNEIETPNMDKLVEKGITFTQCFNQGSWSGAVCVASRTMLITGQKLYNAPKNKSYLDSWAQLKNTNGNYEPTKVHTWAEVFNKNSYETFITGNWHNSSYSAIKGFKIGIGIGIGDGMHPSVDSNGDKKFAYNRPEEENLWDPTQLPHRPPSIPENHPDFKSNKNLTEIEKTYASMVKILDEHVGVIIEELKTLGLYENTIIVLSGYNGHEIYYPSKGKIDKPMLNMQTGEKFDNVHTKYYSELVGDVFSGNDGMAGMKRDNWEGAVRVPLIYH